MAQLQATWIPEGRLFFWAPEDALDRAVRQELPPLLSTPGRIATHSLARPEGTLRRHKTPGLAVDLDHVVPLLTHLRPDAPVSDAVRCFGAATKLAVALAAAQRVVPSVDGAEARWKALLVRKPDRARFETIVAALPPVARCLPAAARGPVRLHSARSILRAYLDRVVDTIYRQGAYPGTAKGWAYEFAESLRNGQADFSPRDARFQAIPTLLTTWSSGAEATGLTLGLTLELPEGDEAAFPLRFDVHATETPEHAAPLADAWTAGPSLELNGRRYDHPAHHALRALARAARIHKPLAAALRGRRPQSLVLDAAEAWDFLAHGVEPLRDAGFDVTLPEAFDAAGSRRIRARMRVDVPERVADEPFDLGDSLAFRWEVTLGDTLIEGEEFAELVRRGAPIASFHGEWVVLDPAEVAKLPTDLRGTGSLPAADALRAVLTGEHHGVPVASDDRLQVLVDALREPPAIDPPAGFEGTLRPYQERGYAWLTTLGRVRLGACLADDMGLGKTVQLITHLLRRSEAGGGPHLVVCPTSVLGNWSHELRRFAPSLTVLRYHGLDRDRGALSRHDVVLTTYGLLGRDLEDLQQVPWDVLCLDEAQSIKNPDSVRARSARALHARHRVALSGTPVENRLDELWSLMQFLVPGLLGPRSRFRREVAIPVERFGDEDVARRLKLGVSPFLLRRLKTDPTIVDDLPEKIERVDYTSLTNEQARLYREVVDEAMERIREASDTERRGQVLAMLTALKQVCNHPGHYTRDAEVLAGRSGKLERCTELVEQILTLGDRAILFTQYREMGGLLQRHFAERFGLEVPFLHGGTPATHREDMVAAFQTDAEACPLLLVSLRAGGTGLNLTAATHVIHYDRWWNPAVEDQATDRAYRIGQHRNVQVHKLVSQGTLEERIDGLLEQKRALAEKVVASGEKWVTELDDEALRALVSLGDDAVVDDE